MENPWWYIFFNHLLWLFFFLICYKKYKRNSIVFNEYDGNFIERPIFVLFAILIIFSVFNFSGGDEDRYRLFVEYGFMDYGEKEHDPIEQFYVILASFSGRNFLLWKLYVYGGAALLVFWSLWKLKSLNYLALLGFAIFAMGSYGHTRGVLAYAMFLFGYSFFASGKKISTLIGLVIIYMSHYAHSSLILPIVLSILVFLKLTRGKVKLMLMAFPFIVVAFNLFTGYLISDSSFMDSQAGYKFETYTDEDSNAGSSYGGSFLMIVYEIYGLFIIGSLTYFAIKAELHGILPEAISKIARVSFYLVYMSFVIYFSSLSSTLAIFQRYFTMAPFFLFVTMPYFLNDDNVLSANKKDRYIWLFFSYRLLFVLISTYYQFSHIH